MVGMTVGPNATSPEAASRLRTVAVTVTAAALVTGLWISGWLPLLERTGWDLLLRLPRPGAPPTGPFAAVLIDDASLARLGPMPWPRERLARLVDAIGRSGAEAVAVDILLVEDRDDAGDAALAAALDRTPGVLAAVLAPGAGWLLPRDRFGGADRAAHAHAETDADGVVRSVSTTKQAGGLALPALSIAAARLAGADLVVEPGRLVRPDFRERPGEIPAVPASQLLVADLPVPALAGRVVFLGLAAAGASDQMFVPVGSRSRPVPGVLVHASAAASLLRGGLLTIPPWWLVALGAFAAAGSVQVMRTRAGRLRAAHPAVALAAAAALGVVLLWTSGLLLPMASLAVATIAAVVLRESTESRVAQRETGAILTALLDTSAGPTQVPAGVEGRLRIARRLQTQLARDRDLRRSLLEGLSEGVVLWGPDGEPLVSNAAAAELWGHVPRQPEVQEAAEGGGPLERRGRILEIRIEPLAVGSLGLLRDATAATALDRRRREMQRLVSHELKTPLASISGFGEMLETYQLSPDELHRVARLIRSEADRLGEMVRAFLDLERMAAGAWEDEAGRLDLSRLAAARCEIHAPAAAATGRRLELRAEPGVAVEGVERLLARLLDNLIGNALKHTEPGASVVVEIATRPSGAAELRVADDGPGIPAEAIPHLFERFYRVPGTPKEGSGLGLAVVKEVADRHRARVSLDTAPGRGTCIIVVFEPVREEAQGT